MKSVNGPNFPVYILFPERDLNRRPPDYRLGVITTTLSEQPYWLYGQSR